MVRNSRLKLETGFSLLWWCTTIVPMGPQSGSKISTFLMYASGGDRGSWKSVPFQATWKCLKCWTAFQYSSTPFLNLFSWSTPSETQYKLINPREMDSLLSNTEVVNIKIDWEGRHQPPGSTPLTPWGLIHTRLRNVALVQAQLNILKFSRQTHTPDCTYLLQVYAF